MKQCSFCRSKNPAFLLQPELKSALKIPKELLASFNYICSDHFEPSNLTSGERRRLKPDAFPTIFPQPLQSYFDQFFNLEVSVCLCLICLLAKVVSVCLSLSAFKSQESDDDSIYPASFASTQKTESSQVGSEYQDNIDEDNREEEGEVDGEEEEEEKDAAFVLVRKESLWPLLSKCQNPGCSEHCEIMSHFKG